MSARTNPPLTSAEKITRYAQAISSNTSNLVTELNRVSAPVPSSTADNAAILRQLQTISEQLAKINTRLDALEKPTPQPFDHAVDHAVDHAATVGLQGLELWCSAPEYYALPTAEAHNARARLYNCTVRHSTAALLPLHNSNNKPILGFPTTLGHLAQLNSTAEGHLLKAFALGFNELIEFCGVKPNYVEHAALYSVLPQDILLFRVICRQKRDAEILAAGPPTAATKQAAAKHNTRARQKNRQADSTDYPIMPLHDERNLAVPGFPAEYGHALKPKHLADVLYFLEQYGQSVKEKGCVFRWQGFIGIPAREEDDCYYHAEREWLL